MKKRTLLILNIIFMVLSAILDIVLGIIFKFDIRFYYATLFTMMGISLGNVLFILLGYLAVPGYDISTYQIAREASYLIIGVGAYYIVKYINRYEEYPYLYWIITILLIITCVITFIVLDKLERKKNANKPRIVANKR